MKKLLLILLTLLLCTGCAAKTTQENPNPADKKESITEEQPENTASLACRTVKGEAFFHRPFSAGWLGAERANTQTGCSAGTGFTVL